MRKLGWAMTGLLAGVSPMAALAQTQAPAAPGATPQTAPASPQTVPAASGPARPSQTAPQTPPEEEAGEEIVVNGVLRGAVPGDVKPELQLSPADIRAYGASSVSDLLNALGPQLGSGSGRGDEQPVILLSGRRSTFQEIRNLPTEAIERIDVLPEEAALQYGYGANQKVINFVLRRRFQAVTTALEGAMPTAGGNSGVGGTVNVQKINRGSRVELDARYGQNSGLLESERGIARSNGTLFDTRGNITGFGGTEIDPALSALAGSTVTVAGVPTGALGSTPTLAGYAANANRANVSDVSPYRTLGGGRAARRFGDDIAPLSGNPQQNLALSASYTPVISEKVSANATIGMTVNQSESLLGLPSATLRLPAGSPYSPFSRDVQLLRYYDDLLPLSRHNASRGINAQVNLNGQTAPWIASWQWSLQASYNRNDADSTTTRGLDISAMQAALNARDPGFNPYGPISSAYLRDRPADTSKSTSSNALIDAMTTGSLLKLPAGDARLTLNVRGRMQDRQSQSLVANVIRTGKSARDSGSVRGNISIPIASRNRDVLGAIGDLSLNANMEVEQLSDFGRLVTTGYGLNWSPINAIRANISFNNDSAAPSAEDLANPLISTPNSRVYDFVRNETVDIIRIDGGNPLLRADSRKAFNIGARITPFPKANFTINTRYTNQTRRHYAGGFGGVSAEIEAAFPDRFVREPSTTPGVPGRLLSVDYRPINFERSERSTLHWDVVFTKSIPSPQATRMRERRDAFLKARAESQRTGQPMPAEMTAMFDQFRRLGQQSSLFGSPAPQRGPGQGQGQGQNGGQPPAQGEGRQGEGRQGAGPGGGQRGGPGGGGGGGRGGFGGGGGGNQIRFTLSHDWVIKDEVLIRQGIPVLNRLDGSSGQSSAAHRVETLVAVKRDALLLQASGAWASGFRQMTGALGSQTQLKFGSLATIGLLGEFNPGQDVDFLLKHPWFRGSRVQLKLENILDSKQRVTDQNGVTPANFVPNLRDPFGRVVRLTFRKQFF